MEVTRASNGRANLHIWREGREYWCQKSPVFLKEWTNVQFTPRSRSANGNVSYHDIRRQPLRFAANTFDAVDVYHVFEHLTPAEGKRFVDELYRVLKPGGVCRVSVPDLERICRDYLHWLEKCLQDPSPSNLYKYHWSVWELFDQIVREKSGGRMLEALLRHDLDAEFIQERYGDVFREFYGKATPDPAGQSTVRRNTIQRLLAKPPAEIPTAMYRNVKRLLRPDKDDPVSTGERVRWMYDRVSLRLLLEGRGFEKFSVKSHADSDIVGWERYGLDRSNYGDYGIDPSVYVEARKP
jgi:predicted SAM-dependent methyltransferase